MGETRAGSGSEAPSLSHGSLEGRLRSLADGADASVRFDRFMEAALYDPAHGYYATRPGPIGRPGDFYTAAHVHPMFGQTVGRRILKEYERLGRPARFRVAEIGPGDGTLAFDILRSIVSEIAPHSRFTYLLVERAAPLRARALERLRPLAESNRIEIRVSETVGADGPFAGVVLANELFDAFPCRRLVWRSGGWRELRAVEQAGRWVFTEATDVEPVPGIPLAPGDREGLVVEFSPAAEGFVREVSDHLEVGAALLLDYGDEEASLRSRFPHGSLAAVRAHRVVPDPLDSPGSQDLSTFVNFTRLRTAARDAGLIDRGLRSQTEALQAWGLPAVLDRLLAAAADAEAKVRLRLAAKKLLFGFDQFKVLEMAARGRGGGEVTAAGASTPAGSSPPSFR